MRSVFTPGAAAGTAAGAAASAAATAATSAMALRLSICMCDVERQRAPQPGEVDRSSLRIEA